MKNYYLVILLMFGLTAPAQVGINTTTPGNGAILDISASDKGVLLPRVALTSLDLDDPVTEPDHGVLVFNTATAGSDDNEVTPGYYWWNDTRGKWERFTSGEDEYHYVGELYGGGIVFYVYENGKHGLIASLDDLDGGSGVEWAPSDVSVSGAQSWWNGPANTAAIVATHGAGTYAAQLCDDYANDGFTDWRLPSISELKLIDKSTYVIDAILELDGDPNTNGPNLEEIYWSSTEQTGRTERAKAYNFTNTHTEQKDKSETYFVRAVRAF